MKRTLLYFGFASLVALVAHGQTISWNSPGSAQTGQWYTVGASCDVSWTSEELNAYLYKNGSFFASADNYWASSVYVEGSSSDSGPQQIEYYVEAWEYSGLYFLNSGATWVTIIGSNPPPVPTVTVDGRSNGATVTRPRAGSVNVTVRYKATDAGGDLTGIRPNAYGPNGWSDTNGGAFVSQSGSPGEVVRSYTLNQNGYWGFQSHARDSANAPNISYSDWFSLTVAELVNNASLTSQTVPSVVYKGSSFVVSQTWSNTGTNTWSPATNHNLGSQNPQDNGTWGAGRWGLPWNISPGANVTFSMTLTAPGTPGVYNFQTRMVHDAVEWFGAYSPNVAINVANPPSATITADHPTIELGQSTTIRGNFYSDSSRGDSIVGTNIDKPLGSGLGDGSAQSVRTYVFSGSSRGSTTFYARMATVGSGGWQTYGSCGVTVGQATPALAGWSNQSRSGRGTFPSAFGATLSNPHSGGVTQPSGSIRPEREP